MGPGGGPPSQCIFPPLCLLAASLVQCLGCVDRLDDYSLPILSDIASRAITRLRVNPALFLSIAEPGRGAWGLRRSRTLRQERVVRSVVVLVRMLGPRPGQAGRPHALRLHQVIKSQPLEWGQLSRGRGGGLAAPGEGKPGAAPGGGEVRGDPWGEGAAPWGGGLGWPRGMGGEALGCPGGGEGRPKGEGETSSQPWGRKRSVDRYG